MAARSSAWRRRYAVEALAAALVAVVAISFVSLQAALFAALAALAGVAIVLLVFVVPRGRQNEERARRRATELAEAERVARLGSWRWRPRTGVSRSSAEVSRLRGQEPGRRGA